jgi:hypothetical protein
LDPVAVVVLATTRIFEDLLAEHLVLTMFCTHMEVVPLAVPVPAQAPVLAAAIAEVVVAVRVVVVRGHMVQVHQLVCLLAS